MAWEENSVRQLLDDRSVEIKGDSLKGKSIDFIVSGGIGAIESPRLVRELRRHGAEVRVVMTKSASQFITPMVFEWASARPVFTELSGAAEHLSFADAVVVAPCTLDFVAKMALGIADSGAATLVQSILGRKPLLLQLSMHEQLSESPVFVDNLKKLLQLPNVYRLSARAEENKWKMPEPASFAAEVAHFIHQNEAWASKRVLLNLGPTQAPLDEVRYLSNYSSGKTGLQIADAFFRKGCRVSAVAGPVTESLPAYLEIDRVNTAVEMLGALQESVREQMPDLMIFSAAVLDFESERIESGKVSSQKEWKLNLKASPKIIDEFKNLKCLKVGFKLEAQIEVAGLKKVAKAFADAKGLDLVVANRREDVQKDYSKAFLYERGTQEFWEVDSRKSLAEALMKWALPRWKI